MYAATSGHLDCLKYLHETAKAPWNYLAVREAHENNHPECLQYLLDNDCPLPTGWRYEGGTVTHVLNTCSDTQRERERERDNREREKYYYPKNKKEVVRRETHPPRIIHLRKRLKKSKTDLLSNARESLVFSTRDERYSLSWSRLTDSERVLTRS